MIIALSRGQIFAGCSRDSSAVWSRHRSWSPSKTILVMKVFLPFCDRLVGCDRSGLQVQKRHWQRFSCGTHTTTFQWSKWSVRSLFFQLSVFTNHYQHRLNWPRWKKEACFWTLYVVSTKRSLSNKFIIQGIRCNSGRSARAHGQPRLCTSVGSIRGERRRSGVLLWGNRARIRMFHVSTWNVLELLL